jgi:hypothetical protein
MAYQPRLSAFIASIGAALALAAYVVTETCVSIFDAVFLEPMRWLFRPDAAVSLDIDTIKREAHHVDARHLERDKTFAAFVERERDHKNFSGGGFVADFHFACVA